MAADYIPFDKNSDMGRRVNRALQLFLEGRYVLGGVLADMQRTITGDASTSDQFALTVSQLGYTAGAYATANDAAKASWDELQSLNAILTATNPGTYAPGAAISQAAAKHGV